MWDDASTGQVVEYAVTCGMDKALMSLRLSSPFFIPKHIPSVRFYLLRIINIIITKFSDFAWWMYNMLSKNKNIILMIII
jgi:hypothetical protein